MAFPLPLEKKSNYLKKNIIWKVGLFFGFLWYYNKAWPGMWKKTIP